jgi:ferrochelatase
MDARAGLAADGLPDVSVTYVNDWHARDGFIEVNARHAREALERLPEPVRPAARLVFTAHSIPVSMPGADRYRAQLLESAQLVASRLGREDWALVFQSRSGRPEDAWLEPDVCDYLRAEKGRGLAAAVLCPIGFLCDHVEVLYDLDHEAAAVCRAIDLPMARAGTVNDDPRFLDTMADLVLETWDRYRGAVPLSIVPAVRRACPSAPVPRAVAQGTPSIVEG